MKLLLLIVLGLALAEAKPNKQERAKNEECSDILPEEACQMIALNRKCMDDDAAQNCRKTCKVCHGCEDQNAHYCKLELDTGMLDCNSGEHSDFCKKTCKKCDTGEEAAPITKNKAGNHALRRHKISEDDCTDEEDAEFCSAMLTKKHCADSSYKEKAKKCEKTCGLCFECEDISELCSTNGIDVCGQEGLEHFCIKSCDKCSTPSLLRAMAIRLKRAATDPEAEDPLAHLLREETASSSGCMDISHLCDKYDIKTVCDNEKSMKVCRKTCNKCNARSNSNTLNRKAKRAISDTKAQDPLPHLMRKMKECSDNSKFCNKFINDPTTGEDMCANEDFLKHCHKSCNKCNLRSTPHRALKTAEDPLMYLVRQEACVDKSVIHCMKVKNDGYCDKPGKEEVAKECPKMCGKCGTNKRLDGPMLNLDGKCEDDVEHCEEIKSHELCANFETNHICKLTCGLCTP